MICEPVSKTTERENWIFRCAVCINNSDQSLEIIERHLYILNIYKTFLDSS